MGQVIRYNGSNTEGGTSHETNDQFRSIRVLHPQPVQQSLSNAKEKAAYAAATAFRRRFAADRPAFPPAYGGWHRPAVFGLFDLPFVIWKRRYPHPAPCGRCQEGRKYSHACGKEGKGIGMPFLQRAVSFGQTGIFAQWMTPQAAQPVCPLVAGQPGSQPAGRKGRKNPPRVWQGRIGNESRKASLTPGFPRPGAFCRAQVKSMS